MFLFDSTLTTNFKSRVSWSTWVSRNNSSK